MNFKLVKLEDIAQISTGGTPSRSNPSYWENGGIPWVKIRDLKKKFVNETEEFITEEGLYNSSAKLFPKGTLLYTIFATIGECAILNIDATTNQAIAGLIVNNEKALTEYVYYFLKSIKEKVMYSGRGVAQNNINLSMLKGIEIPLPNLKIQKKIVEILNKASELIEKRKAQIEALDQLTKSVFLEMFGNLKGEKVPLSELCYINPSKKEIENIDKEFPVTFLPMANVSENGELDLSETRLIKEVFESFTYFREGDVLFAKITPCMENGKGAIARNLINNIGFGSTEFHVLRPKENVNSTWLYYLTSLQSFRKQAEANMTGSAGQKRVPKQFFSKYKVVLPPIELQNQFAKIVQKIQSQKEIIKKSLEELENNFNSLMQRAFKGELFNELMNTK